MIGLKTTHLAWLFGVMTAGGRCIAICSGTETEGPTDSPVPGEPSGSCVSRVPRGQEGPADAAEIFHRPARLVCERVVVATLLSVSTKAMGVF